MTVKSITEMLVSQREGRLIDEATTKFHDLIRQVRKTDKGGKLVITLTVDPLGGDASMVTIKDRVVATLPEPSKKATTYYTTPDANVQRNDPNQEQIPAGIRAVDDKDTVAAKDSKPSVKV